jgi:hypothetical protein
MTTKGVKGLSTRVPNTKCERTLSEKISLETRNLTIKLIYGESKPSNIKL